MPRSGPAAGGGRWVEVDPDRLPTWIDGFHDRHGPGSARVADGRLVLVGGDRAMAELYPPPGAHTGSDLPAFLAQALAPRRLGLLLARQASAAVGVAEGATLRISKVDSWYVQGRTAAGGQSQQRFARRRANQASAAAGRAADLVARLLLPAAGELAALVTGGDRRTVETILGDPRLAGLAALRTDRHLPVPTPNLAVLRAAVEAARAIRIRLWEPGHNSGAPPETGG